MAQVQEGLVNCSKSKVSIENFLSSWRSIKDYLLDFFSRRSLFAQTPLELCQLFACSVIFHAFFDICGPFHLLNFNKKSGTVKLLGPISVGPDLGPNYLQRLSADHKIHR